MNLKVSKEGKASGNITFGESTADVKDGKIENGILTFTSGTSPQPTYAYSATIKDGELLLSRLTAVGSANTRGGGRAEYVLKKK